jgi:hypothetical protein
VRKQRSGFWVLGLSRAIARDLGFVRSGLLLAAVLVGCKAEPDQPSPWEIIEGTATLTASRAIDSATGNSLVNYTASRTGQLTIGADSGVTGWLKFVGQDTMYVTGEVSEDNGLVLTWTGATPTVYRIVTNGSFPTTYALISLDVFHGDIDGDPADEIYLVYWEFDR